jgi:hypothetical protein
MNIKNRPEVIGFSASILLLVIYFGIMTLSESFDHALLQYKEMWFWISLLVAGFGIQVGLYSYIRAALKAKEIEGATTSLATATGVSTTSMVACCAHHVTDIIAIIGLSAISAVLIKYQLLFIILGILSNLVGITLLLEIVQKHDLGKGVLGSMTKFDLTRIKRSAFYLSLLLFSLSFFVLYDGGPQSNAVTATATSSPETMPQTVIPKILPSITLVQDGIEFILTPVFSPEGQVAFDMLINTHSGSLNFDLVEISTLSDGRGNIYAPLSWNGSPPGGHHRSGTLTFQSVDKSGTLTLVITSVGTKDRVFSWNIKNKV